MEKAKHALKRPPLRASLNLYFGRGFAFSMEPGSPCIQQVAQEAGAFSPVSFHHHSSNNDFFQSIKAPVKTNSWSGNRRNKRRSLGHQPRRNGKRKHALKRPPLRSILKLWTRFRFFHGVGQS
ncbi:hypothetical protein C7R93_19840 [Brevibacillus fortis]|uniref:Uncharacterized protein n=1 Tax=Brevibacillus fortis TaxID=2126352 RepID=A0A2P7UZE3_9BACL|nr:hypothetical protein C7R93_19840 [Brevibacillus fortis]